MRLRVWWTPVLGGPQYHVPVNSAVEGAKVIRALGAYDLFLTKHKLLGDTANAGGLEMFDPEDKSDGPEGSWVAWFDDRFSTDDPLELAEVTDLANCHIDDAALLVVVRDADVIESVTVFVPYDRRIKGDSRFKSYYGDVDIVFSYSSTFKMMNRPNSGFHTGVALEGETFTVLPKREAMEQAESIYRKDRGLA